MKLLFLCLRTVAAFSAYIVAFILFQYTPLFHLLLNITGSSIGTITAINLTAALLTAIIYMSTRNAFPFVRIMCVVLSIPAVVSYSKLLDKIIGFDIQSYLSINITSFLFFIMIMLLLTAGKLKSLEDEWETLIENKTCEEEVKKILRSRMKFYLFFCSFTTVFYIVMSLFGFIVLDMKGSEQSIIIIAALGVILFISLIIFIYKKWSSLVDI